MNKFFIYFLFFVLFHPQAEAKNICHQFLAGNIENGIDFTDRVISYLTELNLQNVIQLEQIQVLKNELEQGKKELSHLIAAPNVSSAQNVHYDSIEYALNSPELDRESLLTWINEFLKKKTVEQHQRVKTEDDTYIPADLMYFHPIKHGQFWHRDKLVTIPYDFEMMSTLVTQSMWVKVMGENPSFYRTGPFSIEVSINKNKIKMRPNNPIENITWLSAIVFANRLSELHGFLPAYDLTALNTVAGTRAENGTLAFESGQLKLTKPRDGQTLGYRLPTTVELLFVLSGRGQTKNGHFPGLTYRNIQEYAWAGFNFSGPNETHPVAEKKAFLIDGYEFFDLYGNIVRWTEDVTYFSVDPSFTPNNSGLTIEHDAIGNGFHTSVNLDKPNDSSQIGANHKAEYIGFSLVRTLAK